MIDRLVGEYDVAVFLDRSAADDGCPLVSLLRREAWMAFRCLMLNEKAMQT
jgi:hypothetical protein